MDHFLVWEKLYTIQQRCRRKALTARIQSNGDVVDALYTATCMSLLSSYVSQKNSLYRCLDHMG